jgi:hypothetical protein
MVMASLPTSTFAAGASTTIATTTTTATAVKTNSAAGAAATSAIGGAILGSLAGIAGGVFGTWMSWKNCEYESQQKFILRQVLQFVVGLSVFSILIAILVAARRQGAIPDDSVYNRGLISLIVVSQILNVAWIWQCIRGYKKIGDEAKRRGDPIRPAARLQQIDFDRQQTQAINAANGSPPELFQWNAAGWFGSCIGSSAWMVPLCGIAYWNGSQSLAIVCCLTFLITLSVSVVAWQFQEQLDAYVAVQLLIGLLFLMTTLIFACVQFLEDSATQKSAQWTPWAWCVLFMFPIISLRMWWMRRSFAKQVAQRIS